jgi:hypothetical protein
MTIEQGIAHVTLLIGHLQSRNTTAKIITTLLETYMILASTTTRPLQDTNEYPYVISPWIDTIKHYSDKQTSSFQPPTYNNLTYYVKEIQPS